VHLHSIAEVFGDVYTTNAWKLSCSVILMPPTCDTSAEDVDYS